MRQNYKHSEKTKVSLGVACCRFNDDKPEILLVCKRYTYAYCMFVHARYNSGDNQELINLFNNMTVEEKLDILSLNFVQIWYRVWLNHPKDHKYYVSKNKFESTFLPDGGARLRKLINKSSSINKIWEIPKGRKKYKHEPDLNCAVREFSEETGMPKKAYKIFAGTPRTNSFRDAGVNYTHIYYIAVTKTPFEPRINFASPDQINEICDIRWMPMDAIKQVDNGNNLQKIITPIFNYVKKHKF